jgi:DNA invertase Pin-like site-specific DNA recombinase
METPCERCGWEWEGFHICFDASKPEPGKEKKERSVTWREALSNAAVVRWEEHHEANIQRDLDIVERYKQGASYSILEKEFSISRGTLMRVMHKAQNEGRVVIRPQGMSKYTEGNTNV